MQTIQKNNLVSLLDTTFPNANRLFCSPARADGHEKWVDFVAEFWHCECIRECSEKAFMTKYQRWCKKNGYNFSEEKAHNIYNEACGCVGVMPKSGTTKLLVKQAVSQLKATSSALAALKQEMQTLAAQLPEYPVVMGNTSNLKQILLYCIASVFLRNIKGRENLSRPTYRSRSG